MKKLRPTEEKRLQIHSTGRGVVYSLVLPISHIRALELYTGRTFQKGDVFQVSLLEGEPGWTIRPERKE